ncbi:MAG: type III-B CRISPR module-associated protein Cmr5 [Caldimicrobium sp.]|nr:type III-B CRISPR module-associated protein Cmr5 [Caldimicrobium sp.]
MGAKESLITKLEKGRAEFAYECVKGIIKLRIDGSKYPMTQQGIRDFKEKVVEFLKKQIKKGAINISEEEIREILNDPEKYFSKMAKLSTDEKKVINEYKELLKDFRSYVRKLPQMILSNGLGQTLAFVYAKKEGGNAYDIIYKQLTDYLKSEVSSRIKMPNNQNELIEWAISLNSYEYRYVTEELLALFIWIRKFAEGMIKVEEEGE